MKLNFDFTSDGLHDEFTPSEQEHIMAAIYEKFSDFQHGLLNEFDKFHHNARWIKLNSFEDLFKVDSFVRSLRLVNYTLFMTNSDHNLVMIVRRNSHA